MPGMRKNKKKSKLPSGNEIPATAEPARRPPHRASADKLMMRFYEPLVLQHALGQNRGPHIACESLEDQDPYKLEKTRLRRSFITWLAYICAYDKGGATVTAIALERTPAASVIFWVAANDLRGKVVGFLQDVLESLAGFDPSAAEGSTATAENITFRLAVDFGRRRLKTYWQLLQDPLERSINLLEGSNSKQDKDLKRWLTNFRRPSGESDDVSALLRLCQFSYETRASHPMVELFMRSRDSSVEDSNAGRFLTVRHYIGRLSCHMKAAKTLVAAAATFPAFFDNFEIKRCPSSTTAKMSPRLDQRTTLDGIVVRMLPKDDGRVKSIQQDLLFMDEKFGIQKRITDTYNDPKFLPRVHAELMLLEQLYANGTQFIDGDKYIGCSKPACYCCYHYICAHPGGFVRPPSHNNTYLNWRPPDLADDASDEERKRWRDIIIKMTHEIRKDVIRQIMDQSPRRASKPDSTTGISTSVVAELSHSFTRHTIDITRPASPYASDSPQYSAGGHISDD